MPSNLYAIKHVCHQTPYAIEPVCHQTRIPSNLYAIKPVCHQTRVSAVKLSVIEGEICCWDALEVLETPQVMPRVLLHMLEVRVCKLEAVEGGFGLPEVLEVIRCALLCMLLEVVEDGLCSLEVLEVWMVGSIRWRCSGVEGGFCLLDVLKVLEMPEVIRCAPLCMLEAVEDRLCSLEV